MKLHELSDNTGAHKRRIRVGRGMGSGKGKTSGAGQKGQTSRSGVAIKGFEGGQMPLYRRLPKRGFNNPFRKRYNVINLGRVQELVDAGKLTAGETITIDRLQEVGLVGHKRDGVRLLAEGELKVALTFVVDGASKAAIEAVEKASGKVQVIEVKKPVQTKRGKKAAE